MPMEFQTTSIDRYRRMAFVTGGAAAILTAAGYLTSPEDFFRSYLFGFVFWVNISVGSLAILMLHHMVSGRWGFMIQRPLEAATRTLPLMTVLFVPVIAGLAAIYPWAHESAHAAESVLEAHGREGYLNVPFFVARAAIYFGIWNGAAWLLRRWSAEQDNSGDPGLTRRMRILSAPGLMVYALTATFASIDWVMSLEPEWWSTIYGMIFIVGQCLAVFALMTIFLSRFSREAPLSEVISPKNFHHLGNLILTFVILWAYTAYSQYVIIWMANLPEEIPWYLRRMSPGWRILPLVLIIFHFFLPFLLLLSRKIKQAGPFLARIAAGILLLRLLDLFWLIMPALYPGGFHIHWLNLTAPVAIGGIWLGVFFTGLKTRPALPRHDPRFEFVTEKIHAS